MINLPKKDSSGKPYLSYSQKGTWKKSKKDYIRQYFFGEKFTGNAYTDFGSKIGEALEVDDFSKFTPEEQTFLSTIPRYDVFEKRINLDMGTYFVVGYVDSCSNCSTKLLDYKTGDVDKKASEYESDTYTQLEIYSAAIQQEVGVLPNDVSVVLIDRKGNPFKGGLSLGNRFITITKNITQERIDTVLKDIDVVANDISDYYKVFLKLKELK